MKPTSIRRKLMGIVLVTTLAALLINGVALALLEFKSYRDSQLLAVRTQADILARASAAAVAFDDRKEAREALRLLRENRDVFAAAVYLQDGRLFASYERQAGSAPPRWPGTDGFSYAGDRIQGFQRVVEEGTSVGAVYLDVRSGLHERILQFSGILAVVLAAALALALVLSTALQRSVTQPIHAITAAARSVIERHDYSVRASRTSGDETGVLADAFNQMLAEIDRRSKELAAEVGERRQAEEALRVADRRKNEFLATLAHELRNPLAPIRTSVQVLKLKGAGGETDLWARNIIDRQVTHMARLLDDLLDVGRITGQKLELRREVVTLNAVLDAAVETSRPLIDGGRHALELALPAGTVHLDGDPVRLCQVFANLLNNSAKYTPPGGRITLAARLEGAEVVVAVRDNGIGIAPEALPHVFDIFSQALPALERTQGGLGIGLFLVKSLVELHGGSVAARSAGAGAGTEVEVRLRTAPTRDARPAPRAQRRGPRRVLVADDNADTASSLAEVLRILGHEVRVAQDGAEALSIAAEFQPEAALLDIGMPRMNGYEAARRIRQQPWGAGMLLVAVTGWGQEADRRQAAEAGFDRHVTKPLGEDVIAELFG